MDEVKEEGGVKDEFRVSCLGDLKYVSTIKIFQFRSRRIEKGDRVLF